MLVLVISSVFAQDPAQGWTGYAKGVNPANQGFITRAEGKWKVGTLPSYTGCFYSPWFGIESSDEMNLLQPVNPTDGYGWTAYTEYFQWSPVYNYDSNQINVNPGDILHGTIVYDKASHSYTMTQTDVTTGQSTSGVIPIQGNKNFTIMYVVQEKVCDCDQYSPDGAVLFYDIILEFNGKRVKPKWTTSFVDDNCNARAHVVNTTAIEITWDTSMKRTLPLSAAPGEAFSQRSRIRE